MMHPLTPVGRSLAPAPSTGAGPRPPGTNHIKVSDIKTRSTVELQFFSGIYAAHLDDELTILSTAEHGQCRNGNELAEQLSNTYLSPQF